MTTFKQYCKRNVTHKLCCLNKSQQTLWSFLHFKINKQREIKTIDFKKESDIMSSKIVILWTKKMGRKSISVPSLANIKTSSLRTSEWWEGVRGGVRDSVRYFGEKIPQKFSEFPLKVHEDVEKLQRKLSLASLLSKEDLQVKVKVVLITI